ncbi:MAG: DegV family protein, partial [Clostridiales bacterium]|nr:DegV family protein [Clostridiales bacterium]
HVVDTLCASLGEGMMVHLAMRQHEAGMDDDALVQYILDTRLRIHHWFTVDDLAYLKRGGRVSGAAAAIGTMLSIKPVLGVDDAGHLIPKEKVQGRRRAIKALADHMAQNVNLPYNGPIFISHCDCENEAMQLAEQLESRVGAKTEIVNQIGPVVGAHSGPGTLALFFVGDRPRG